MKIDVSKFVVFNQNPDGGFVLINGERGRRSGQVGKVLGSIALKHAAGYEILLQFPDGKLDTFTPFDLYPADIEQVADQWPLPARGAKA